MNTIRTNRRPPTFLWQAVLIVLPVAVLAIASLISLRSDEVAAERAARQRAAANVQSLASIARYTLNEEIQRFVVLQNMWTMELRVISQPSVHSGTPNQEILTDIAKWERDYPGLRFTELATGEGSLLADGRQIAPPDLPAAPAPPKWFCALTPHQQELWDKLPRHFADRSVREPAFREFEASGVSNDARQAAINLEQRLKFHHFTCGVPLDDPEYSESGLSFRSIALQQMLCDPKTPITNTLQQAFWSEVIESPSFMAPLLLELADKRINEADALTRDKFGCMRQVWNVQGKERDWLAPLRQLPELTNKWNPPAFWAHWTQGPAGEALALGEPATFGKPGVNSNSKANSNRGHNVWFVPREVLEAIFTKALADNQGLIPDFAGLSVSVEGRLLPALSRNGGGSGGRPLLASSATMFGNSTRTNASFELTLYLSSQEKMLAAERRRAKIFGTLILLATLSACVGLLAAWRAFQRQLALNEQKSNFVSSVSHELRAPIASVRLMAENLEGGRVHEPQKQQEYFRFIGQECRRLSALIENVLDFSRIEQGRKQYEFEPTDLVALAETTVKLMEPYAAEKGVRLAFDSALRAPHSELNVDGRAIQQALVNLIDNAVKHSPKGQTVTVGLEVQNTECGVRNESASHPPSSILHPRLSLWVQDRGPGIPAAEHAKIFERFYRRGSELRRETQGIGIGLSLVKHIVDAHGGRVTVQSEPGKGSRFTIELPFTK